MKYNLGAKNERDAGKYYQYGDIEGSLVALYSDGTVKVRENVAGQIARLMEVLKSLTKLFLLKNVIKNYQITYCKKNMMQYIRKLVVYAIYRHAVNLTSYLNVRTMNGL